MGSDRCSLTPSPPQTSPANFNRQATYLCVWCCNSDPADDDDEKQPTGQYEDDDDSEEEVVNVKRKTKVYDEQT
jgi:hypothetical protein